MTSSPSIPVTVSPMRPHLPERRPAGAAVLAWAVYSVGLIVWLLLPWERGAESVGGWVMTIGIDLTRIVVAVAFLSVWLLWPPAGFLTPPAWKRVVPALPLLRFPSRSLTIVGDRAQARHGFPESWPERLVRVGLDQIAVAFLSINYRTPLEVMVQAAPVIRGAFPDANVPTSVRSTGVPIGHGRASDFGSIPETWLAAHADGIACVVGDPTRAATSRVRSLTPELVKGLEFDLIVLIDPQTFGTGTESAIDRYVAIARATQQLVILTNS